MDLKKLLSDRREELAVWTEFRGMPIQILYKTRREIDLMLEKSKIRKWKKHQMTEDYDDSLYTEKLAGCIGDWKLTLGKLSELTNISLNGENPDEEVPCNDRNKATLLEEVYGLINFIQDTCMDIEAFRKERLDDDLKNSETSQDSESERP